MCRTRTRTVVQPDAFVVPQGVGRNGDVHHNSLRGPQVRPIGPFARERFSQIAESKTLEFKWETYNVLNHVNLANPNSYIGDPQNVGKIFAAADMRRCSLDCTSVSKTKSHFSAHYVAEKWDFLL